MIYIYISFCAPGAEELLRREEVISVSDLAFLALTLSTILAISMVVALVIHDPEEGAFIQTTIEVFWLIVHAAALAALAIVYTAALLWGIGVI